MLDGADGDQLAARGGAGFLGFHRRVAAADDDRIAEPDLGRRIVADGDLRQAVERGRRVDQKRVDGAEVDRQIGRIGVFIAVGFVALFAETGGLQFGDGDEVFLA